MDSNQPRTPSLLPLRFTPEDTIFLECDIQAKVSQHWQNSEAVIHNGKRMT